MSTKDKFGFVCFILSTICLIQPYNVLARQSMKVVEEPSNYGINVGGYQPPDPERKTLKMRVPPSNFSGPPHLKRLMGKCFTLTDSSYKYELCPFSNLTQHEQSLRWNPYSGILGVWEEWHIENNTFVAMVMREGDRCGSRFRNGRVYFKCGNKTELIKVEEPSKCDYAVHLQTPLVCHPHSMLVYPTLTEPLREQWDILEGQYENEEFTKQGYLYELHHIFEKAGYCLPESYVKKLSDEARQEDEHRNKEAHGDFDTLEKCSEEYKKLRERADSYRRLLEMNGINPDNGERDYMPQGDHQYGEHQYDNDHHYNDL